LEKERVGASLGVEIEAERVVLLVPSALVGVVVVAMKGCEVEAVAE